MDRHRQSGYLADDESFRRPQMGRNPFDWGRILRPPSRCQFRNQRSSTSTSKTFARPTQGKRKRQLQNSSSSSSSGKCSNLANEFSEFVDFLADEEVLDSLQLIMEDAVQKLRNVTTQSGEPIFDLQEGSPSRPESEIWSYCYSHSSVQSETRSHTTTASSSEDDWERSIQSRPLPKMGSKICLLDKYVARLPRLGEKVTKEVSAEIRSETFSERSDDSYLYQLEHLHLWANLAQSFEQLARRDHFAHLKKAIPTESFSTESLHKEITSVLKQRSHPCYIPLYSSGEEPFEALDFLEESKVLAALQDIINQAVLRVLEATMTGGIPFITFDADGRPIMPWELSADEESSSEGSESGEGSSETEEGKSADGTEGKKKKRKGKKKDTLSEDEKRKAKSSLKSRQKSGTPEEPSRKPKYVPPPLSKSKPRAAPEETPGKPKYQPPPLPKPRKKQQEPVQTESEASKAAALTRQMMITKDIKRARLQARPLPKESIIDFLTENAAKLILYKYNYEALLSEKLGFISVPVTKVLLEIMFGYKKVKGSGIRLSSQIDWAKVYDEIYKKRPPKPKPPKPDKKKKQQKKKAGDLKKTDPKKKTVLFKPPISPKGKVVIVSQDTESIKADTMTTSGNEEESSKEPEIFEIVPPQFPKDPYTDQGSPHLESPTRPSSQNPSLTQHKVRGEAASPSSAAPKLSSPSTRRTSGLSLNDRGSTVPLPEVESTSQLTEIQSKKSLSNKLNFSGEGSKTVFPKISK